MPPLLRRRVEPGCRAPLWQLCMRPAVCGCCVHLTSTCLRALCFSRCIACLVLQVRQRGVQAEGSGDAAAAGYHCRWMSFTNRHQPATMLLAGAA